MKERGFFHPSLGYWQTNSDVPADVFATYPQGTVEVPIRPGADFEWLNGKWVAVLPPRPTREQQQANRAAAFQDEADPLFFKWQAGEGTKADWEAKRAEIRERYPYPD